MTASEAKKKVMERIKENKNLEDLRGVIGVEETALENKFVFIFWEKTANDEDELIVGGGAYLVWKDTGTILHMASAEISLFENLEEIEVK